MLIQVPLLKTIFFNKIMEERKCRKTWKEISSRQKRRLKHSEKVHIQKRYLAYTQNDRIIAQSSPASVSESTSGFSKPVLEDGQDVSDMEMNCPVNILECSKQHYNEEHISPESTSSEEIEESDSLLDDIRLWALKHCITHLALSDLLKILKKQHSNIKADSRTLLHTPCVIPSKPVNPGFYCHLGLASGIRRTLKKYFREVPQYIEYDINVDGLPISKSSRSQFWVILGSIKCSFYTTPFAIGIYHGDTKPTNSNTFLEDFVSEAIQLKDNGLIHDGDKISSIRLRAIICDAPARSFVTCTKNHSGYFGCSKCIQEGDYVGDRVIFPETNNILRTDESFKIRQQEEHHKDVSILLDLNIGMVSQVPLDYMHLVCLGVTKKLLQFWIKGKADVRIPKQKLEEVQEHFIYMKSFIVYEFARTPRSLFEVDRYKATEFRQILLYTGLVLFKNILPPAQYNHFLSLSCAIRILCTKQLCEEQNHYAKSLLHYFVEMHSSLYGLQYMSYNIHNLIHLADDVKNFGCLDEFSSFKYENFMYDIKRKLKTSRKPLQQIYNRLTEESLINREYIDEKYPYINEKKSAIIDRNFSITTKFPNNVVKLHNGKIMKVLKISESFRGQKISDIILTGVVYLETQSFFSIPCDSKFLGIQLIDKTYEAAKQVDFNDVETKCMCLPLSVDRSTNIFLCIPFLHNKEKETYVCY